MLCKTRFAPSPTGNLHLGNVRTALFSWLMARAHKGQFLLRLEDTDTVRSKEEFALGLLEDLHWLELAWDEGPGAAMPAGSYYQSERSKIYDDYFARLEDTGRAYPCFCSATELELSRKRQASAGLPPRYVGSCSRLSHEQVAERFAQGKTASLRFRVPVANTVNFVDQVRGEQKFDTDHIGDFIIRRTDGTSAFFFCNAVDDALMEVTDVLRGEDHLTNTPRQILILQALDLPIPRYSHIPLVFGDDGAPLSKRHGSIGVGELRKVGYLPLAINNYLGRLGHRYETDALLSMDELASNFAIERVHRSSARFDAVQLKHWQRLAVAEQSEEAFWQWLGAGVHERVPESRRQAYIQAVRPNVLFPEEAAYWAKVIFQGPDNWDASAAHLAEAGPAFFEAAQAVYEDVGPDGPAFVQGLIQRSGKRGKAVYLPLRLVLTGEEHGPDLKELIALIPAEQVRARFERGRQIASAN